MKKLGINSIALDIIIITSFLFLLLSLGFNLSTSTAAAPLFALHHKNKKNQQNCK